MREGHRYKDLRHVPFLLPMPVQLILRMVMLVYICDLVGGCVHKLREIDITLDLYRITKT